MPRSFARPVLFLFKLSKTNFSDSAFLNSDFFFISDLDSDFNSDSNSGLDLNSDSNSDSCSDSDCIQIQIFEIK